MIFNSLIFFLLLYYLFIFFSRLVLILREKQRYVFIYLNIKEKPLIFLISNEDEFSNIFVLQRKFIKL